MSAKPADAILLNYAKTRDLRDRIRSARDGCLCDRAERGTFQTGPPCWKEARKWTLKVDWQGCPTGDTEFRFDPPIAAWCPTCRQRQAYTEQLRAAIREHAAAKRSVLQRGRALTRRVAMLGKVE
jgi:hypothetical protein